MKNRLLKILLIFLFSAVIIQGCNRQALIENDNTALTQEEHSFNEKMLADYLEKTGSDAFILSVGNEEIIRYTSENIDKPLQYAEYNTNPFGTVYRTGFYTMSTVKSWTSILVGTLIDKKIIKGTDIPVSDYIPEWKNSSGVTLHHLLTMTSGLKNMSPEEGIIFKKDKNAFAVSLKPSCKPGEKWSYSNEAVQIIGMLIEKLTGQSLSKYAQETLFKPLGMDHTAMWMDKNGLTKAYADAITGIDDFHKIGQLVINGGKWNGKQIISGDWLKKMFTMYRKDGVQSHGYSGFGYLCWLDNMEGFDVYIFSGQQNARCIIIPQKEMVLSTLQKTVPEAGGEGISLAYVVKTMLKINDERRTFSQYNKY